MKKTKNKAYTISAVVAVFLAVVTVIEYVIALYTSSAVILLLLGLVKAYAVVNYFMHISRLWSSEEGH